ncbi:type II toxin-antitoxin system RelE/ParE family toxin [Pseudomonas sp. PH1b]|uniref:type II toxin-antitoxin system RelE family toxin n=1 Tax=Pseudomonas sp. PH1b TaxID=1397282 RepID=UPI000468E205|nr:type II toxin-antitoxin system RelE/ParE family toxin [Pseudomonas sp. PH1b]
MHEILWSRKAVKQLLRLHPEHQVQVRDAIALLADMPANGNVKALSGHTYAYRLRVGQYRVLFDWDGSSISSVFERSKKRDEGIY